jgi:hypothetical protein
MPMPRPSLDYLAGLFDGEGSFSIQVCVRARVAAHGRPSVWFSPATGVNLYYGTEVLAAFVDRFGGKVYRYRRNDRACGERWYLGGVPQQLAAARTLAPLLVIKAEIVERFIGALELFPMSTRGLRLRDGERAWSTSAMLAVAETALTLNPPRSRKSNKTLEYLEVIRGLHARSTEHAHG